MQNRGVHPPLRSNNVAQFLGTQKLYYLALTRLKIISFIKPREKHVQTGKLSKRLFLQFLTCNS
jgi:hypothetical protein